VWSFMVYTVYRSFTYKSIDYFFVQNVNKLENLI